MSDTTGTQQPPLGVRLLHALGREPDLATMSGEEPTACREAQNRKVTSGLARLITGVPDRRATTGWQQVARPDRTLRVYRPSPGHPPAGSAGLPPVHGGGFVGTAVQCDWLTSHLAGRLSAVVVSVEHRLLTPEIPLSGDGWDVLPATSLTGVGER